MPRLEKLTIVVETIFAQTLVEQRNAWRDVAIESAQTIASLRYDLDRAHNRIDDLQRLADARATEVKEYAARLRYSRAMRAFK